jgi:hypothetical protein
MAAMMQAGPLQRGRRPVEPTRAPKPRGRTMTFMLAAGVWRVAGDGGGAGERRRAAAGVWGRSRQTMRRLHGRWRALSARPASARWAGGCKQHTLACSREAGALRAQGVCSGGAEAGAHGV